MVRFAGALLREYPELAAEAIKNTATDSYGGPVVTASGLLFIGATSFDKNCAPSTS
jgi:quinoprotein glucose dehydrogenase